MPKTLFTPTSRDKIEIVSIFPRAILASAGHAEDVFQLGECRITCRYWTEAGDFVSKQKLGCGNAIRTGVLACVEKERAEERVCEAESVLGIVGPETVVNEVARALATRLSGVLISSSEAVVVG